MAAHEGSEHAEHAEHAERRDIGEATLDQLRADVVRLSHEYMTGEPLPLFLDTRRVRNRIYAALDRRLWPRDTTELYLLLGCLNCLMALAADDLGYPQASDELLEIGGEFGLSRASQHYLAGSTLVAIPEAEQDAVVELESAAEMYAAGPEPGEDHCYQMQMLAHIDLAVVRLRTGELDAADAAVQPVLALPSGRRIDPLPQRLGRIRAELARPRYQGSPQADDLDERIEYFTRETVTTGLASLPGGPG